MKAFEATLDATYVAAYDATLEAIYVAAVRMAVRRAAHVAADDPTYRAVRRACQTVKKTAK